LKALGIENRFERIIISEEFGSQKPTPDNYLVFEQQFPAKTFVYVGDNLAKDFIVPNERKWLTICLKDRGENVHPQNIPIGPEHQPHFWVNSLLECQTIIDQHASENRCAFP